MANFNPRIDFIGVGFGRTGSKWLANCLYEHPEISIPRFNLHTEINYFPEEYEVMGLKNYYRKFLDCDERKVVGELSTLIIFKKRSSKLLKKLFPNIKIIIYRRKEEDRATSDYNIKKYYDLLPVKKEKVNQKELIDLWIKKFGRKKVFIFNMDNKNKQNELNKLFRFLGVEAFTPSCINKRFNESYVDREKKMPLKARHPILRKAVNLLKPLLKKNPKAYYFFKRSLHFDYYFQLVNHKL